MSLSFVPWFLFLRLRYERFQGIWRYPKPPGVGTFPISRKVLDRRTGTVAADLRGLLELRRLLQGDAVKKGNRRCIKGRSYCSFVSLDDLSVLAKGVVPRILGLPFCIFEIPLEKRKPGMLAKLRGEIITLIQGHDPVALRFGWSWC